jgi:hypothetical protein
MAPSLIQIAGLPAPNKALVDRTMTALVSPGRRPVGADEGGRDAKSKVPFQA